MKICVCTNQESGLAYVEQSWRNCFTCDPSERHGVCIACAERCHVGHDLSDVRLSPFFCDCGAGALENADPCLCYTMSDKDIIIRSLSSVTDELIPSQVALMNIEGVTSPHTVFIGLGLLSTIYDCGEYTSFMTGKNDLLLIYSGDQPGVKTAVGLFGVDSEIDDSSLHIDSNNTMSAINEFVAERTVNAIPQLLESEPDGGQTIVSVACLNMNWDIAFDEEKTTEMVFTINVRESPVL